MSTPKKGKLVEPETRADQIAVRVPKALKEAAMQAARDEDRTLSKWVERLIREAVERQKKPN